MRLKDKIIANIAKAIKGIQEAVFFKSQAQVDDGPLILRNNDRQCHKLCENLDHVFLHGLRHVTNGYWKVAVEFTHKNAVREIERLQNVTTNLGRGRAWIFMSLNECLLESYIRCIADNTKFLRKHYVKEALLLDQQQMSVLLTLTSGLECVEFRLEYDLPYLDLSAYPPRTRTASEVEEEESDHVSLRSMGSFSSRHNSQTAASTPDSTKALTDSDTASVNSLDAAGLRRNSTRISTISTDSGCPADLLSLHSNKQRSVTPTDTMSVSSHGSSGEPDRLTRLENIVSTTEDVEEGEGGGLEVIRVKGAKKGSGNKKKSAKKGVRKVSPLTTQISAPESCAGSEYGGGDDVFMTRSMSASDCGRQWSLGGTPPQVAMVNGLMQDAVNLGDTAEASTDGLSPNSEVYSASASTSTNGDGVNMETRGRIPSAELERLTVETRDSLVAGVTQLSSAVASIRAKAGSPLWAGEERQQTQSPSPSSPVSFPVVSPNSSLLDDAVRPSPSTKHSATVDAADETSTNCDNASDHRLSLHTDNQECAAEKTKSALEEMESKCAQLCRPVHDEFTETNTVMSVNDTNSQPESVNRDRDETERRTETSSGIRDDAMCAAANKNSDTANAHVSTGEEEVDEVDFYSAPSKFVKQSSGSETHSYSQLQDYVDYISGRHDNQLSHNVCVSADVGQSGVHGQQREISEGQREYALSLDNNTKLQIMLDIFTQDDEEFVKMFVTREGHTEGEMKTLFVLVTNYVLYFLQQRTSDRKFQTELKIHLKDLSFISLSLNKQIVNIESSGPNRRKERIWLTPGDSLLAQEILECLEEAVKKVVPPTALTSRFSIGSDEPLQTIALRKYIARDCHCQEQEVEIEDYTLVCWEDTQASRNRQSTERDGTLLLRVNDPFKGHLWKPVFVVLRDAMLCVFTSKADNKPQQYVRLDGEQCVGCRLETSLDRPHCIEIILAKGGSWYLSAASFDEVSAWRQSLCLAVSEGVQTKFCRTIASAKVEEVTSLTFDPEVNTYCIVVS
nr:hypothetical protein BaRGS_015137 [Batillaria attramentaria]